MEKKFWASWPGMTHFLGNDLEDIEYLIHILIKLNKSIKSPKKKLTMMQPSIRMFTCSYNQTWIRERWE